MERLTFLNGDGIACVRDDQCCEEQSGHYCGPAIDRLAEYEDLGMLAEEIVDAVQQETAQFDVMQALQIVAALKQLNAYKQAEQEGYLVALQCKPGQHVFILRGYDRHICECVVTRIILGKGYRAAEVESADGTEIGGFPLLEWGRTAFATREEAERAEKPDVCFAKAHAAEAADEVLKGMRDGH